MRSLPVFGALLFAFSAHAEVTIDWVTVGDPGNAADTEVMTTDGTTGYGSVDYVYGIGRYEVTNAQYAEFLNAVAATDTNGLYHMNMASVAGGITRSPHPGPYTYSTIVGREDMPVNWVSFYDTLRFANWLHNGQPTGAQDSTTTEDGAYTITAQGIADNSITRNAGATIFLTREDEWYKAAYYVGFGSYFDYPASSDTLITCAAPGATANTANCDDAVGDLTVVGSYTGSASPSGSVDQGGNVWEWNEAIISVSGRGVRGGGYYLGAPSFLAASHRVVRFPEDDLHDLGFRVASPVSAPPVPSLSPAGISLLGGLVFGIGIVGLVIAARRRFN